LSIPSAVQSRRPLQFEEGPFRQSRIGDDDDAGSKLVLSASSSSGNRGGGGGGSGGSSSKLKTNAQLKY